MNRIKGRCGSYILDVGLDGLSPLATWEHAVISITRARFKRCFQN